MNGWYEICEMIEIVVVKTIVEVNSWWLINSFGSNKMTMSSNDCRNLLFDELD